MSKVKSIGIAVATLFVIFLIIAGIVLVTDVAGKVVNGLIA